MSEVEIEPVGQTVTQQLIDTYADLSGDYNPIHVDPEAGMKSPFKSTIAHGPISLQPLFVAITRWQGGETITPGSRLSVSYRRPVRPGDTITCVQTQVTDDSGAMEIGFECRNQNEEAVIVGTLMVQAS